MRTHPTTSRIRTRVQQLALVTTLVLGLLGFATTGVAEATAPSPEPAPSAPADRDTFSTGHFGGGSDGGYATQVWKPTASHNRSNVLVFKTKKEADKFTKHLNGTKEEAEKLADKGEGDTSKPDDESAFTVRWRPDGWVVSHDGRTVGVYKSEEKANAVANAMDEEVEKRKKKDDCIDPDVFGREPDALTAA